MPNEIWGVGGNQGVAWPDGPLTVGLMILSIGLLVWALWRSGASRELGAMTRPQWATFIGLCGASLLLSQLFPLSLPWSNHLLETHPATSFVALLSTVPYLLAGLALNTPAAILVGLLSGLGRALGQSGAPIDIVAVGLAAGLSAVMMRQNYAGRLFGLLRQPVVAGSLGRLAVAVAIGLEVLAAAAPRAGMFAAIDIALFIGAWSIVPLLVEGAVGGMLASVALWIVPMWRPDRGRVPSPLQSSLQRQLVSAFLAFAALVVMLSALVAFYFSARSTERTLVEQMVDNADATAARLGELESDLSAALIQFDIGPSLATADPAAKSAALGRMQASPHFTAIRLISESGEITSSPAAGGPSTLEGLTPAEQAIATAALSDSRTSWSVATQGNETMLNLAVPQPTSGGERFVLLAQVAPEVLADILGGLPVVGGRGQGLIIDERERVLLSTRRGDGLTEWARPTADQLATRVAQSTGHPVFSAVDPATGARQLIYTASVPENGWSVVAIVPNATILRETLGIIGPLALLLLAISTVFYTLVAALGRDITQPIADMSQASRAIAVGGGLERPVRSHREDEIGQLSLAFSQMQRALRQRLDELSLLLSVSNEVAATIHIDEGMSAVLQGVLRGTGAAGARAIVRNPNAPAPLVFAEGPAAESMSPLDRAVLLNLRNADELALGSAAEIQEKLAVDSPPMAALFAMPLRPAGDFQGVLYVAYRQPHYFDSDERGLLRTLAGQATVLVQNAHLFAAAESGRRRLAAILASTTNAVIVTDQTDRILLLNPAMEGAFGLRAQDVTGRPVVDVLVGEEMTTLLARRLSLGLSSATGEAADGKLELGADGRVFLASISTVFSSEGQTMGRVAVLQDVTDLKEVDRLKSEFVAGISHDLLSPLTYMHNYASMLPIVDDPALEHEYADKILGGIDRMKRLVNDLLDLARIEAGLNLQFDRVPVVELLEEVAQEYASPANAQGIRLVVEAAADLPPAIADPAHLRRAITNLVTNGLRYAPDSGPLTMAAEANDGEIIISIRDGGPGIPSADQAHLFEKFYRGQSTTADMTRGSGLGLAIVKSVADHHNGRVWCESTLGEGSTFFLALPLHPSPTRSG